MIEQIYSGGAAYIVSDTNSVTIRLEIGLKDPVDKEILQETVWAIDKRFPYLKRHLGMDSSGMYYESTDRDFVLKETAEPIKLNSIESNENLLAFSYKGKHIYIDAFHGQFDGTGLYILAKALLYDYCLRRYGGPLEAGDVIKTDSPIEKEEYLDPYPELLKWYKPEKTKTRKPKNKKAKKPVLRLDKAGKVTPGSIRNIKLELFSEDVMAYCKSYDGSPATSFPLMLAEAIHRIHSDSEKELVMNIPVNQRPALKVKHSHHSTTFNIELPFEKRMWNKDLRTKGTIFRGMVILKTDEEEIRRKVYGTTRFLSFLNKIPFISLKRLFMQKVADGILLQSTATVSYTGKCNFGDLEQYVEDFYISADSKGTGITVEVASINESFFLSFNQDWQEDVYLDSFLEVLKMCGIRYKVTYDGPLEISKMEIKKKDNKTINRLKA